MQQSFTLPVYPAGSHQISCEIYSHQNMEQQNLVQLISSLRGACGDTDISTVLILGGRTGLTAEIMLSFGADVDVVQQNQYHQILVQRFVKNKNIQYFFGREGNIGSKYTLLKPDTKDKKIRIISSLQFANNCQKHYDIIILQNIILNQKANLVQQLFKVSHRALITMIVPGRIMNKPYFPYIKHIEKSVIMKFYQAIYHQRLTSKKYITGRRQQVFVYQIFGWIRNLEIKTTEEQFKALLEKAKTDITQNTQSQHSNPYQTQQLVDMYLGFHYGPDQLGIQNYPQACAKLCIQTSQQFNISKNRALDLGCAVGRTTIDLTKYFNEAVGLDFSSAFIKSANQVLNTTYPQLKQKIKFVEGDACNLKQQLGKFSLIFGGNLIDRLPDPQVFLNSVGNFLNQDGLLILTSPYSWLQQYTPKQKWIGGYIKQGKQIKTHDGLAQILLKKGFQKLKQSKDIRFVIKQNDWVCQYTLANATFWKKTSK